MATSSAQEIIEIIEEDRVLKEAGTIHSEQQTFELACELVGDRGEGKG